MNFEFKNGDWVDVPLDAAMAKTLMNLTKKELVEKFVIAALAGELAKKEIATLRTKLDKAEAYIEQGRAMIESVMDRWHEYDV